MEALFPADKTVITRNAKDVFPPEDVKPRLERHHRGDWGDIDEKDRHEYQVTLAQGLRLFSVYRDRASPLGEIACAIQTNCGDSDNALPTRHQSSGS